MTNQSLINRIIADANTEAKRIVDNARSLGEDAISLAKNKAQEKVSNARDIAQDDATKLLMRRETLIRLDASKLNSNAKRQCVDLAYDTALALMCEMNDNDYSKYIIKLVSNYGEKGDSIEFSTNCSKATIDIVMASKEVKDKGITLSSTIGSYKGGIMLIGKTYDKCLTFENILDEHRQSHESEILGKLL